MLFNSIEFAIFFPVVVAMYFLSPQRWRVTLLLAASCFFYMAFIPVYILILLVTILIDYFAGIYIERVEGPKKKALLCVSIVSTCAVLFVFKYLGFFSSSFEKDWLACLDGMGIPHCCENHSAHRPLFFPHVSESELRGGGVYRGRQKAEHNFLIYATYVMFFPQLVAGPIERPQNLLHQFREWHEFNYVNVTMGLKRMAWGFFKKLVVADRLALYVNDVYGSPRNFNGLQLTLATFFFAYQIYCDFSGYSDIAIGAAQVLGFKLMENFQTPYYSLSIGEFWKRWHISLSTWFRDYVYIPLGGNRVSTTRHIANLLVTFVISGLWHGANWTYVWWGFLNGFYLIMGGLTKDWRDRMFSAIGLGDRTPARKIIMLVTTFGLTCLAWVVFRANNMRDAVYVVTHFARGWDFQQIKTTQFMLRQLPVAIAAILALEAGQLLSREQPVCIVPFRKMRPLPVRWAAYAAFVMLVVMFGVYRNTQFIYFQF